MKILIVGSGGREHALAWKAAQRADVEVVYVAPGNAGTMTEYKVRNVGIDVADIHGLIDFARGNDVDLTIVGPELPLVLGIVDRFEEAGLKCFGPNKAAARLEGSKAYMKEFCTTHGIPTGHYQICYTYISAVNHLQMLHRINKFPVVIKADGLAAGKGVIIAHTVEEAIDTVSDMMVHRKFGDAGNVVVIEEFLRGEEVSFIVMTDGNCALPMASSQDYKPIYPGGPNTGGMGAYSPSHLVDEELHADIMVSVIYPALMGMIDDGQLYTGFLYAGLMIDEDGFIKVLEFNCRAGDPETQPIMMRMNADLIDLCMGCIDGSLKSVPIEWDERHAVNVVMAAGGYPGTYKKGDIITGIGNTDTAKVFHAGTSMLDGEVITSGGRVLGVCTLGDTLEEASKLAYHNVHHIDWDGKYFREDIGVRNDVSE